MNIERVKRLQDYEGHWYWIPEVLAKQFEHDLHNVPDEVFMDEYDKYRTGGAPDVDPGCFDEADQVIEVLLDRTS